VTPEQPELPVPLTAAGNSTTPGGRLARARACDAASEVTVSARDLLAALSFQATRCEAVLLGVAEGAGCLELCMRYETDVGGREVVSLGIRLPVQEAEVGS
jgi:hypothetical protein